MDSTGNYLMKTNTGGKHGKWYLIRGYILLVSGPCMAPPAIALKLEKLTNRLHN